MHRESNCAMACYKQENYLIWLLSLAITRKDVGKWAFLFMKPSKPSCLILLSLVKGRAGPWYAHSFVSFHLQVYLLQDQLLTAIESTGEEA